MKLRSLLKGAMLVTVSALLIAIITLLGLITFVYYNSNGGRDWNTPTEKLSDTLFWDGTAYSFSGDELLEKDRWAMLLNHEGQVVWSLRKPDDVPEQYTVSDVASFTRWYLGDYPVQCRVREDGLLVVGSPKGSIWKHDIAMDTQTLLQIPIWFLFFFLLALSSVLGLVWLAVGRWFRQDQQVRDAARSNWINGVSHDIRTPLSVVMGYAAQLEEAQDLAPEHKRQACAIRAQSQVIRDLVNDLNLTMRLDCEMQALRKESLQPAAFLRQAAADFLNGGMGVGFDFEIDLPETLLPEVKVDSFLLRRAVNNLLTNCVRHNAPGCSICLGGRAESQELILWVEGGTMTGTAQPNASPPLGPDGGAAHGTGLRLVAQIAAAHGGKAEFHSGIPYRCELRLPVKG
ncbi:sensor histidine kinase [Candidatus Agathobaculum pullicola]|uniref:sensor histidine kinase n=1 Tax=Candidatus Agathobaculum pullicola TaxID=2838426 RepID=UPI003F912724